jgi:hypothetical protein
MAINEALSMESKGGNATDDNKTLSQRQTELAEIIMQGMSKDSHRKNSRPGSPVKVN